MAKKQKHFLNDARISEILLLLGVLLGIGVVAYVITQSIVIQEDPSLLSFALINLSGYLFFIISPVEVFFAYMLILGSNTWILIGVAIATAMFSQLIDYLIGYYVGRKFLKKMITEKKYKKYHEKIRKYGNATIFIFNLTPLSSPILLLVAGMVQYDFEDAMFYSFLGLLLKYIIITLFFA